MTMAAALSLFLDNLTAAPVADATPVKPGKRSKSVSVAAPAPVVSAPPVAIPSAPVSGVRAVESPKDDKVDGAGFLAMLRNAGKRPNANGVLVTVSAEVKPDQIKAMMAYKGYSSGVPFGSQLDGMIRQAKSEARPDSEKQAPIAPSSTVSMSGYVAGLPRDETEKKVKDILGRINLYGDTMAVHIAIARDSTRAKDIRKTAAIRAAFEKARINEAHKSLSLILEGDSK